MNRSRFAYFLNAVHYCIWLDDIKLGVFLRKFSSAFISLVLTICFTKKFKRRQEERMAKMQKIMNKFYYEKVHIKYEKRKNAAIKLSIKDLKGLLEVV